MARIRDPKTGRFVRDPFRTPTKRGPAKVFDEDAGYRSALASLGALDGETLAAVGTFDGDNPLKAAAAEFGFGNSPQRPFMSSAFDSIRAELERDIAKELAKQIDAGRASRRQAILPSARKLERAIVESLDQWTDPQNAPSTTEQKGFGDPLVESGELRGSIEVKEKF